MRYKIIYRRTTDQLDRWHEMSCSGRVDLDSKLKELLDSPSIQEVRIFCAF